MKISRNDLTRKIELGEDSCLELKEVRFSGNRISGPQQDGLADEIAAFANSYGGMLILGVDNSSREVQGIPINHIDSVERLVKQACVDSIDPPVAARIERIILLDSDGNEKNVICVGVSQGYSVYRSPGGYYYRIGSSKQIMSQDILWQLFQQRSRTKLINWDETPVPEASLSDLDERLWSRFSSSLTMETPELFLSKLGIVSKFEPGNVHPTVAGVLLACREPQRFLPNAFIQAVAYHGNSVVPEDNLPYQLDARDITGPLDQQIIGACEFVRKNSRLSARKIPDGGRVDSHQYDYLALFEAFTNAVAHRDYSIFRSKTRLRLFNNRLELYIPGMLANSMTTESLPYKQAVRNETIASLLARCPVPSDEFISHRTRIMDKRGEGVPIILEHSKDLSGKLPVYRLIDRSELMLTIHAAEPA